MEGEDNVSERQASVTEQADQEQAEQEQAEQDQASVTEQAEQDRASLTGGQASLTEQAEQDRTSLKGRQASVTEQAEQDRASLTEQDQASLTEQDRASLTGRQASITEQSQASLTEQDKVSLTGRQASITEHGRQDNLTEEDQDSRSQRPASISELQASLTEQRRASVSERRASVSERQDSIPERQASKPERYGGSQEHANKQTSIIEMIGTIKVSILSKSIMHFVTLTIFFVGVALVAVGSYSLTEFEMLDDKFQKILTETFPEIIPGLYIIIISGVVLVVIGLCGFIGSIFKNKTMLVVFFLLLSLFFGTQIIGLHLATSSSSEFEATLKGSMDYVYLVWVDPKSSVDDVTEYVQNLKEPNDTQLKFTSAWLSVQGYYKCCGYDSPYDWYTNYGVPPYVAYCTENGVETLVSNTAASTKAGADPQKFLDHMKKLSQKEFFKENCEEVFKKLELLASTATTVLFSVQFGILCFCLYYIMEIRSLASSNTLEDNAQEENK